MLEKDDFPAGDTKRVTEEPEPLPDFEEEIEEDVLQLDANADMDDDLNKVNFHGKKSKAI